MKKLFYNIPTLQPFRSINYSLYFSGRAFSQLGTAMQRTAVIWVIYTLTRSEFLVGLTIFAELFPSFIFSTLGGVYADKYNKYAIVKITQILSFIQAITLAFIIFTGRGSVWSILTLSIILGIINAFDVPARQSLIHEVVKKEAHLRAAISLNSAMASTAKLLGPVLSGLIIHAYGASICFLLNALSFGAVYLAFQLMNITIKEKQTGTKKTWDGLKEGFLYLKSTPSLALVILMIAIISLFLQPYNTLIPVFAKKVFNGNAATYGYISGFIGAGAVIGTLVLTTLKKSISLRKVLLISTFIFAISLIFFSQITQFYPAMIFAALVGFGQVSQFTLANIIIQTESSTEMRGRAISILVMAMLGMAPIGSIFIGIISEYFGAPQTLLFQGVAGLILTIIFTFLFYKQLKKQ
ncbi:MFS transporter [Zhouia sp. PK063]|uniref:MFS transporter n=1 Tax=Zhouia sp. PK063 TaxID=3373602 RepID=UPI00378F923E